MIYTKPVKHDNCKDCIRSCEHAGKDREFVCKNGISCKKSGDKFDNIRKEAIKEFAEKLKEKALLHCKTINCYELKFIEETIDELLKV